jgi:hypothetical protein
MRRVLLVLLCILIAAIGAISQESMADNQSTSAEMATNVIVSQGMVGKSMQLVGFEHEAVFELLLFC